MRRWILIGAACGALALLALPCVALYYALFTPPGLQLIARLVPRHIGSVQIQIEGVRGTAVKGVHIDLLEIEQEHVHLRFEGIDGRALLPPLLLQTLRVPHASIQRALIEVRARQHPTPPSPWYFVPHWMEIRADDVHIEVGTLVVPNGQRFEAHELAAAGIVRSRTVRIFQSAMRLGAVRVIAHGTLRARDPLQLDAEARIGIHAAHQPTWIIDTTAKGDLDELPLTVRFSQPLRAVVVGRAANLTGSRWHWQGDAQVEDFDLRAWGIDSALGHVSGQLAVEGDAAGFSAHGPLTPAGLKLGVFETLFAGAYAGRTFTADRIEITHRGSGAQLTGSGTISIVEHGPRLDLHGTWRQFRWPLSDRNFVVRSDAGEYRLEGIMPYTLHGKGMLEVRELSPFAFDAAATLSSQRLTVSEGAIDGFGGHVNLAGFAAWAPRPSWSASGMAFDVNPASVRPNLPGRVSFGFEAAGQRFASNADLDVTIHGLTGRVRNLPARADGRFAHRASTWELDHITADLAGTSLSVAGTISTRADLRFNLASQDLSLLGGGFKGRLAASGTVRGTPADPVIDATANGGDIEYAGVSAKTFDARVDFNPHSSGNALIHLRAHELAYSSYRLNELSFALDGPAASQTAKLVMSGGALKVEARAAGRLADSGWVGELQSLDLNGAEPLRLKLVAPVGVHVSSKAASLERLCLAGSPARVCMTADWSPRQWSASLTATDLPIRTLTAGMSPRIDYGGIIAVDAEAIGRVDAPVQGSLHVKLTDAKLAHRTPSGRTATTILGNGSLTLNAAPDALLVELGFNAGSTGTIKGHFTAQRSTQTWRDMPLKGELEAQTADLDLLTLYVPQIDRAAGNVSADLAVAGTLGTPLLSGALAVSDGELDLYQVNLAMRSTVLQARLLENGLDFSGATRIGAGSAAARGHVEWHDGKPFGRFKLSGDHLRIVDVPEAMVEAAPDLTFALDGQTITVTGSVTVPQARIAPADLSNAVRASSDEVIVGQESPATTQRFRVLTDITLTLGDRVSIDTTGLKGRLAGSVAVRSGVEAITRATGELNVHDGQYAAFGRRLDIERGRLIFNASPVDNPGLDVRAVKRFDDPTLGAVVAGINVRGTLQQPQISFFSEPPLAGGQQQVASLLLAGGSLGGGPQLGTPTANGTRTNAELIGQGAAILGQQLGSRIADVGVESDLNNDTSLVLGRYLSPRLYVSYGLNLTQSLNTVKLRYTLGDHWMLRTEVGQVGGADLVYSFDK